MDLKQPVRVQYLIDEPDFLNLAKTYLEQDGEIQVEITSSPHEIQDLVSPRQHEEHITDSLIPDMDGLAILRQVRAIA